MTSDAAYEISWDASHLGDDASDAALVKFPGWEDVAGWQTTRHVDVPETIFFEANTRTLKSIDFPLTDVAWPILSRRMLDALLSVQSFAHRAIPLLMLDDTVPPARRLDASGAPLPGVADDRFVAVQLLDHTDALDWDRSEYAPHKRLPGRAQAISKVVLKPPPEGLPPLFRLSAKPRALFVSAAGREALEAAGIKGVIYRPLDKVRV